MTAELQSMVLEPQSMTAELQSMVFEPQSMTAEPQSMVAELRRIDLDDFFQESLISWLLASGWESNEEALPPVARFWRQSLQPFHDKAEPYHKKQLDK